MSNYAIKVENLSKLYRIGERERYYTFRDVLTNALRTPFHWLSRNNRKPNTSHLEPNNFIWALRDVSFEIKQGEVVGIIGRNGAGKSTLLKILSRITEPTEGYAEIHGRVGSLLEVGTGFHSELTGRENIYLNGAILGMKKAEIQSKFDEIVAFSGVERFIDTPVKRYSSGMYVRLAFAVAAHLEPEILLVDEVLAVGDAAFQKKCLGKMGDVARQGRTVLFVSHNMQAVSVLCSSTILLENGKLATQGPSAQVVGQYLSSGNNQSAEAQWSFDEAPGTHIAKLRSVRALNDKNEVRFDRWVNEPVTLKVEFWLLRQSRVEVSLHLYNEQGILLFATGNFNDPTWRNTEHEPGLYACSWIIPKHLLNQGQHYVHLYLGRDNLTFVEIPEVISFKVLDAGDDTRGDYTGTWVGLIRPILPWTGERIGDIP